MIAFTSCGGGDSSPSGEPTPTPVPAKVSVTGVTVNKTSISLMEGEEEDGSATVTPDNASNKSVSWKSDDPSVATVSGGKITAVAPGMTTITVTTSDGSKTATVNVTVTINVPGRQKRALLALFEKTGGTNWTNKTGWNTDSPLKDWYGVKVSGDYVTVSGFSIIDQFDTLAGSVEPVEMLGLLKSPFVIATSVEYASTAWLFLTRFPTKTATFENNIKTATIVAMSFVLKFALLYIIHL